MGFDARLQHARAGTFVPATTIAAAFTNNPTPGNLVVCGGFVWDGGGTVPTLTVKDGNLNSYTITPNSPSTGDATGAGFTFIFWLIAPANADKTLTLTVNRSMQALTLWIEEITITGGAVSLDMDVAGTGASGTAINTGTVTVVGTNEFMFCCAAPDHGISAAGGSWIAAETLPVTESDGAAYILSTSSNQVVNFTQTASGGWGSMGASWKQASTPTKVPYQPAYQMSPILAQ